MWRTQFSNWTSLVINRSRHSIILLGSMESSLLSCFSFNFLTQFSCKSFSTCLFLWRNQMNSLRLFRLINASCIRYSRFVCFCLLRRLFHMRCQEINQNRAGTRCRSNKLSRWTHHQRTSLSKQRENTHDSCIGWSFSPLVLAHCHLRFNDNFKIF